MVAINEPDYIDGEAIRGIARRVLEVFDKEKIDSLKALRGKVGKRLDIPGSQGDILEFLERPSNRGTKALVFSYARPKIGIPLNVICNEDLDYSQFVLKTRAWIEDYKPFSICPSTGLIMMYKWIETSDFSELRKELETLTDKGYYSSDWR